MISVQLKSADNITKHNSLSCGLVMIPAVRDRNYQKRHFVFGDVLKQQATVHATMLSLSLSHSLTHSLTHIRTQKHTHKHRRHMRAFPVLGRNGTIKG